MQKADQDLQSDQAVCLISPMGSLRVKAKIQSFFFVQHKAEHTVDAQEIAPNLNQQRRAPGRLCLHKGHGHAARTPLGSFFYELMVKSKGYSSLFGKIKR